MNKTVTVNISGFLFNIEEEAYRMLSQYLDSIRSCFHNIEEQKEIMSDIEARIAELFQERVNNAKEVINKNDVEEVISIMGKPEDYATEEETQTEQGPISSTTSSNKQKRVFRDVDNAILGGVGSGIANYFAIDPVIIRIILVVLLFGGIGFLIYIILWIIIPAAVTTADKLKMKGEPINVENIKQHVKDFGENIKEAAKSVDSKKASKGKREVGSFFRNIGRLFAESFSKLFGILLIIFGIILSLFTLDLLAGRNLELFPFESFFPVSANQFFDMIFETQSQSTIAFFGALIIIAVPAIGAIYSGLKILLGIKRSFKIVSITLGLFWLTGFIVCLFSGIQVATEFQKHAEIEKTYSFAQPTGDTLYLDVMEDEYFSDPYWFNDHFRHFDDLEIMKLDGDICHFSYPYLDIIENTKDSTFEINVMKFANGSTKKKASSRAKNIDYNIEHQDSLITFSPYFSIPKKDKLRAQHIKIEVKVPEGKSVYLSKNMIRVIYDIDNYSNTNDVHMPGHVWTMKNGKLRCIECDLDE